MFLSENPEIKKAHDALTNPEASAADGVNATSKGE
jgi:hypothetical protein